MKTLIAIIGVIALWSSGWFAALGEVYPAVVLFGIFVIAVYGSTVTED